MRFVRIIKWAGLRVCTLPGVRRIYRPFLKDTAVVFMLHRFSDPGRGVSGTDPARLDDRLAWLQEQGRPVLDLENLVRRYVHGEPVPPGAVCFTVDDGYEDFFRVGLEVFAKHECPVTVFLPSGFLDGDGWLWWDRVAYMLRTTERRPVLTGLPAGIRSRIDTSGDRAAILHELVEALRWVSDPRKEETLDTLDEATGVTVPEEPPPRYRPMTWDQVRTAEGRGPVRFGPHSVTHPVLSRIDPERLAREISVSWRRVREETERPVPVFAYPDGAPSTFGPREERAVRDAGLLGAVSAQGTYLDFREAPDRSAELRCRLPRFGFPPDEPQFLQIASGLLRLRHVLEGLWT